MFSPSRVVMSADADDQESLAICRDLQLGLCVCALRDFEAGAILDQFSGELTPTIAQHSLQVKDGLHIAGTRYIGYLTHGCDPNCRLDMERMELVATRAIAAQELLTIDYAETEDCLYAQFPCVCGAPDCRRWIVGRRETFSEAGRLHLAGLNLQPVD